MSVAPTTDVVLEVRDLRVRFDPPGGGAIRAVTDVGYAVRDGETLAVVGESGSGKSVSVQAIMGLLPPTASVEGSIMYRDTNLLELSEDRLRALRGKDIAIIPQDSMAALNPLIPVGHQIAEVFLVHGERDRRKAQRKAIELIDRVGIPDAEQRAGELPGMFSGGMRQRLVIAMAVAMAPDVLIADEATSALDVPIQLEILDMLDGLQRELGMSMVVVTHDLLAVRGLADRVVVMYAGRVVEEGPVDQVFSSPAHPYTEALLLSTPRLDGSITELRPIGGRPPGLDRLVDACAFEPRCTYRRSPCAATRPETRAVRGDVRSACHFAPDYRNQHE